MSRGKGIGYKWFEKYKSDCYPSDFLISRGTKVRVPKYYDQLLEKEDELMYRRVTAIRKGRAEEHSEENTVDRLAVKEEAKYLHLQELKRSFENG